MVDPTIVNNPPETEQDMSIRKVTWVLTTANPQGKAVSMSEWADKTFDIDGTSAGNAWGGATCAIQGGNTGAVGGAITNPQTLNNPAGGTALSTSANKVAAVIENPLLIAPVLTTPGAGATVTVTAILRRNNIMRH